MLPCADTHADAHALVPPHMLPRSTCCGIMLPCRRLPGHVLRRGHGSTHCPGGVTAHGARLPPAPYSEAYSERPHTLRHTRLRTDSERPSGFAWGLHCVSSPAARAHPRLCSPCALPPQRGAAPPPLCLHCAAFPAPPLCDSCLACSTARRAPCLHPAFAAPCLHPAFAAPCLHPAFAAPCLHPAFAAPCLHPAFTAPCLHPAFAAPCLHPACTLPRQGYSGLGCHPRPTHWWARPRPDTRETQSPPRHARHSPRPDTRETQSPPRHTRDTVPAQTHARHSPRPDPGETPPRHSHVPPGPAIPARPAASPSNPGSNSSASSAAAAAAASCVHDSI
jgi:hypothetical protein